MPSILKQASVINDFSPNRNISQSSKEKREKKKGKSKGLTAMYTQFICHVLLKPNKSVFLLWLSHHICQNFMIIHSIIPQTFEWQTVIWKKNPCNPTIHVKLPLESFLKYTPSW